MKTVRILLLLTGSCLVAMAFNAAEQNAQLWVTYFAGTLSMLSAITYVVAGDAMRTAKRNYELVSERGDKALAVANRERGLREIQDKQIENMNNMILSADEQLQARDERIAELTQHAKLVQKDVVAAENRVAELEAEMNDSYLIHRPHQFVLNVPEGCTLIINDQTKQS